jgi:PleD family two-component response regulator
MIKKQCVLISGRSLVNDEELYAALQHIADVVKSSENNRAEAMVVKKSVNLVIFEISKEAPAEAELIKRIKNQFPNIIIILVDGDGDREVIARAFSYGAKDAFRKPYNRALIVERVQALLNYTPFD